MSIRQSQFPTGPLDTARKLKKKLIGDNTACLLTFSGRKYYITLGLRSMKWDEWIGESFFKSNPRSPLTFYTPNAELDNHYLKYHADKARRIKERGSKCCHTAPEAMDAAIELLEEL